MLTQVPHVRDQRQRRTAVPSLRSKYQQNEVLSEVPMTRALIVYESMYGNNEQVSSAIADGLRAAGVTAELVSADDAPAAIPPDVSLLVVGAPNHAAGLSRPESRRRAAKHRGQPTVTGETGLRDWFDQLEPISGATAAVAYDTRMAKPRFLRWFDRAASGIEKRLRKRGFRVAGGAEHFYVVGEQGPLQDGEIDRAQDWGRQLSSLVAGEPAVR